MVKEFAKQILSYFKPISAIDYAERSHEVEVTGKYQGKDVLCTIQLKHYIPRDVYGEAGYFYQKPRKRKVKDKESGKWIYVEDIVTYYEMSEADQKFVYVSYVHHHLNQKQISKLSGIPQPYVYRYIKHKKLKPKYEKTPKSERNISLLKDYFGLDDPGIKINEPSVTPENIDIPDDIDFEDKFHLDPYPNRAEWKVRREELGLKNGENWRNTPYDENPGPRQYGDGSKSRRRKESKNRRREERRRKNIKKFNLHQNNRYGMTIDNPEGDK